MPNETPPPKRYKPDSNSFSLDRRVRDCEQNTSELIVSYRAQRKDVINPLISKVDRIEAVIDHLKSRPPPPQHVCLKPDDWAIVEKKQEDLVKKVIGHDEKIAVLHSQMEKTLSIQERDVQQGVKTRQMLEALEDDVDEAKKSKKSTLGMVMTMLFTFALAAASSIYFIGGLSARVEAAELNRREDTVRVTKQLEAVQQRVEGVNQPVVQKLNQLESAVRSSGQSFDSCFRRLSERQKRILVQGGTIDDPPPGCR